MNSSKHLPWLHRLAVLTACAALLLTIASGALVTTKGAGMAFADYPSSDGHNMLLYPWFKSVGDKFLEHGHRLAGVVIGLLSIALAVTALVKEPRVWVKVLCGLLLLGVIAQGLLGGQRVLLNERGLAFVHGSFGALVFALMACVAVVTSRGWFSQSDSSMQSAPPSRLRFLGVATCCAVYLQYVLGGLVRHRGMLLYDHLGFAFVAAAFVLCLAWRANRSRVAWLERPALLLAGLTVVQIGLGAGAWVTRFGLNGLGMDGYVPVHGSSLQVALRTLHVLAGMLLFMTSIVMTVRILRLEWLKHRAEPLRAAVSRLTASLELTGGVR